MYFANRTMNYGGQKLSQDEKSIELTVASTQRVIFVGTYSNAEERLSSKSTKTLSVEDKAHRERPTPFFNWIEERDRLPQSIDNRSDNLEILTGMIN